MKDAGFEAVYRDYFHDVFLYLRSISRDAGMAGDLIPLYVDEVLSADSVALVEEHLAECGDCAAKVQQLRGNTVVLRDKNIKPLRQIKGKMKKDKRVIAAISAGVMVLAIGLTAFFCDLLSFDVPYWTVKNRITVLSGSDLKTDKAGHDAVILYRGKDDFDVNVLETVVGTKNGVKQVEITLYMNRSYNSFRNCYVYEWTMGHSSEDKWDGTHSLYQVHSYESENLNGEECTAYRDYPLSVGSTHITKYWEAAQGGEIVAVYYGFFDYSPRTGDVKWKGKRHLLWSKEDNQAQ